MKKLLIPIFLVALSGCSSVLRVKCDPLDADVYVVNLKSGEKKPLGKTPLDVPMSDVKEKLSEPLKMGDYLTLSIEKSGYHSESIFVPASRTGVMVTELEVNLKSTPVEKEARTAKEALDHIFLAQRLALSGEHERAQIQLDQVLHEFPDFPRALSMRASIYYLQKNFDESLKWYEKALGADPNLDDAIKMIKQIKEQKSVKGGKS